MGTDVTTKDTKGQRFEARSELSFSKDDNNLLYKAILLKTEKLATAIYMVTDLLERNDPMRHALRDMSVTMICDTDDLKISDKTLQRISCIISLLNTSLAAGLISLMNHSILSGEYAKLRNCLIDSGVIRSVDSFILDGQIMKTGLESGLNFGGHSRRSVKDISIKDNSLSFRRMTGRLPKEVYNEETNVGKASRRGLIKTIIKDGAGYTIKDIMKEVSQTDQSVDCSEKTIQRDLLFLVTSGILEKKGERRWSRYFRRVSG